MTEQNKTKVPAELIPAGDYPVVSTDAVVDKQKRKTQEEVNEQVDADVEALQQADTNLQGQIATEASRATNAENAIKGGSDKSIQSLDNRLNVVEQLAEISVEGGTISIASSEDFTNRTPAGDAKIPTVGAILNAADEEPVAGSGKLVKSGGVERKIRTEIDNYNKVEGNVFYITDGNKNIIAKVDKNGVHSVDFRIGGNGDSVAEALNGISGQISNAVNAEKLLREQGDAAITGLVEAEEARAKAAEDTKLNYTITDDKFCITDTNGYIICQIDASGVNSVDVKVKVDEELVSVKTLIDKKLDQTLDSSILEVTDSNGYIIAKIDANGVHSAKDKHAVACMVLSESYYPTAAPVRDGEGNVTYAEVMFESGIEGSISITYTNGNSSSVAVVYGNYNYTITINRDADGNVEKVLVN